LLKTHFPSLRLQQPGESTAGIYVSMGAVLCLLTEAASHCSFFKILAASLLALLLPS